MDDEFPLQVLTSPLTRDHAQMPEVVNIEATGLGGKDLGVEGPWDISIRTDPEGQNVYGSSLATVERTLLLNPVSQVAQAPNMSPPSECPRQRMTLASTRYCAGKEK